MTTDSSTTLYDYAESGNNPIVDAGQLLKFQLRQWVELNRRLTEQNATEFLHVREADIMFCQAKISELETEYLQFSHHLE